MVRRSTWITLGIFIMLLSALLIYQRFQKSEGDIDEDSIAEISQMGELEPVDALFNLSEDLFVMGLRLESSDGKSVEVRRSDKESSWRLIEPTGETDQEAINRVVAQVQTLTIVETLDQEIELSSLGLDEPSKRLTLRISNGGEFNLFIGDVTITNTSYYARLTGQTPVVLDKFPLDTVLNWLVEAPILEAATSTPET